MQRVQDQIQAIEKHGIRSLPAQNTRFYDGWVLRFNEGYTRRANSVQPLYNGTLPLEDKLNRIEHLYAHHQLPSIFKMCQVASPDGLDENLEANNYVKETPTHVMTLPLDDTFHAGIANVLPNITNEWLYYLLKFTGRSMSERRIMTESLTRIIPTTCFATITKGQDVVAVGRAVYEDGILGLFDIAVAQNQRQKGYGKQLSQSLLHWGQSQGAHMAYLQVVPQNKAGLHLYDSLGFQLAYQYWYRIKPN